MVSCNPAGAPSSDPRQDEQTLVNQGKLLYAPANMQLIYPIASPSIVSAPRIKISGVKVGSTVSVFTSSKCDFPIKSGIASSSELIIDLPQLSLGSYKFYARQANSQAISECTPYYLEYVYQSFLPGPSLIELVNPAVSPGIVRNPTLRVSGVATNSDVQIYSDQNCSNFITSKTSVSSTVEITLPNLNPGEYRFFSKFKNASDEISECSEVYLDYEILSALLPPTAISLSTPASYPSSNKRPEFNVSGVSAGHTVKIFRDPNCVLEIGSAVSGGGSVIVGSNIDLADGTYQIFTLQDNNIGDISACSSVNGIYADYVVDATARDISSIQLISPVSSPSNDTTPLFRVNGAETGATVKLYRNNLCTTLIGQGIASTQGVVNIQSNYLAEGSYQIYATQTDLGNNTSACTNSLFTYVVDQTVSMPTSIVANNPLTSISSDNTPKVTVNGVEPGATVRIYTDSSCSLPGSVGIGAAVATTTSVNVLISPLAVGQYTFYAKQTDAAGNISSCSSASYNYEVIAPTVTEPTSISLVTPSSSPSQNTNPTIRVSGLVTGESALLYSDDTCTSFVASVAVAAGHTYANITVPPIKTLSEGTYYFHAKKQVAGGATSNCSSASLEYKVDLSASVPTSISNYDPSTALGVDSTPSFKIEGVEVGATVKIYKDTSCTSLMGQAIAGSTMVIVTANAISIPGNYSFYTKQVDALGNTSNCSQSFANYELLVPGTSPTGLSLVAPASSPGNDTTPTIRVEGVSPNSVVQLFSNSSCTNKVGQTVAIDVTADVTTNVLSGDGSYTFYANQIDTLSNESACSTASVSYVLDTAATQPSAIALSSPSSSPSSVTTPSFLVSGVEDGATVSIYSNSSCSTLRGSATASGSSAIVSLSTPLSANATYTYYAKQVDAIGNASACSISSVSYIYDDSILTPTGISLINPMSSSSTITTPTIRVSGILSGSTVRVFEDAACSQQVGSAVASGQSVDIVLSSLSAGSYTFYANQTTSGNTTSACSTVNVSYTVVAQEVISDTYFNKQWFLSTSNSNWMDINVVDVWTQGEKGSGVNVLVVDDGLEPTHADLSANYNSSYSYNLFNSSTNPNHFYSNSGHGTAVAGVIAARDNSIGVRGVAPRASLSGFNLLEANATASDEASAMTHAMSNIFVSNNSWGPADYMGQFGPSSSLWKAAIENAIFNGRSGKGVVFVWAAGNGRDELYSSVPVGLSNNDEYANHYGVMAVAALEQNGQYAYYSEAGSNLWISAPSGDGYDYNNSESALLTTDRSGTSGYSNSVDTTHMKFNPSNDYAWFDGTSAAAPVISGVSALMLGANSALTWRDVKWILAETAVKNDPTNNKWITNAAGFHYNPNYGFGLVDSAAAVDTAQNWTNLPSFIQEYWPGSTGQSVNQSIPSNGSVLSSNINVSSSLITKIEYITIQVKSNHTDWGQLEIRLKKQGSSQVSILTEKHLCANDYYWNYPSHTGCGNMQTFDFGDASHLGESPNGTWTLEVYDKTNDANVGSLNSWRIQFHGH